MSKFLFATSQFCGNRKQEMAIASSKTSSVTWGSIDVGLLAVALRNETDKVMLMDSRSFLEYNACHILQAINVCCSKIVKRRLQADKICVTDLIQQNCEMDIDDDMTIIVYDQCTFDHLALTSESFLWVLLTKLAEKFSNVSLLKGGFLEFQATHPSLCESKSSSKHALTSMSQPCMPVSNIGPTKILPFLYLGSQVDALNQDNIQMNDITWILNVSNTCPKPAFIQDAHFYRIPINDNYSDKLIPHLKKAFHFLDKVRDANGCVLIHCLAGISRSATLAIAYIMYHLKLSSEEAYRYVKDKRPTISPNFNFLGQLLEFENQLKAERGQAEDDENPSTLKRQCISDMRSPSTPTQKEFPNFLVNSLKVDSAGAQSPTTQLARLNFNQPSPDFHAREASSIPVINFPTTSLDKLNFTPCFAKEDLGLAFRSKTGGTKRPLSTSVLETGKKCDGSALGQIKEVCASASTSTMHQDNVLMRPKDLRPKRLVRPNSIAFSTYPHFDLNSDNNNKKKDKFGLMGACTTSDSATIATQGNITTNNNAVSMETTTTTSTTTTHLDNANSEASQEEEMLPVQMRPKPNLGGEELPCISVKRSSLEEGRKSRSLEDILIHDADHLQDVHTSTCCCHRAIGNSLKSKRSADIFMKQSGKGGNLDSMKCRCGTDPHQSDSSISSSGSHKSLHSSLELIEVS